MVRVNETAGIFASVDQISPEAFKAQRMQELKDIAEWRQRRVAAYQAWSTPEAIAERKAKHEAAAPAALELGRQLSAIAEHQIAEAKKDAPRLKLAGISVTPVIRPVRRTWWQRLLAWLKA
jgi:hypothetical protein